VNLLRPDKSVTRARPDITWCLPINDYEFDKLIALAQMFKGTTPQGMRYLRRIGQRRERIVLVLSPQAGNDRGLPVLSFEDIETECAWLRLCKDIRQPIFVIPSLLS